MMKVKWAVTVLFSVMLTSCESIIENIVDNAVDNYKDEKYVSPYMGEYIGTYAGNEDYGKLEISVSRKGYITVKRISDKNNFNETFDGAMQGSNLYAYSPTSKFRLIGALVSSNNIYNGTWEIGNNTSGTWNITKQ